MAKRKRASLKDKGPDTLGLTQKKGKGIDLLFGGPSDSEADTADQPDTGAASSDDVSGLSDDSASADSSEGLVDELGLPVAMDAPPDDLILASAPVESVSAEGEEDAVDPTMSPFAMPTPQESPGVDAVDGATDLSGLLDEDISPEMEEEDLSSSEIENDLSGLITDTSAEVPGDDLAGLAADDLSGLIVEETGEFPDTAGADDLSGLVVEEGEELVGLAMEAEPTPAFDVPPEPPPSAPPPATAAPIGMPPSAPQPVTMPGVPPAAAVPAYAAPPAAPYTPPAPTPEIPPPSTATGAPSMAQPRVQIDTVSGIAAEKVTIAEEDILPEDALTKTGDHTLMVADREMVEREESVTEQIIRYIGRERREKLDQEIMSLYERVADELSDNKDDAAFALKTLREAQDIVIEDISQYDEALYRVAVVKTMLVRKANLRRWSYSWGLFVFFYALVWLFLFIAGIEFVDLSDVTGLDQGAAALRSAWISALAGGIGGVIAILYSLSWRVAIKHEFDRQYVMKYLVQPVMGFVLGAVIFFITSAGFLLFSTSPVGSTGSDAEAFLGGPQLVAFQILLGFIAGFRQRVVYYMIDRIVQRLSPKAGESKGPSSVVPGEDLQRIQEAREAAQ